MVEMTYAWNGELMMKSIVLMRSCTFEDYVQDSLKSFCECSRYAWLFIKTRKLTKIFSTSYTL